MHYKLVLGNKNYSSWSLRGWLLFKAFDIPFEEEVVPLYTEDFEAFRKDCSPARQVPTLLLRDDQGDKVVWDSLAIAELLAERHPEAGIWPEEAAARAAARCLCAEMHAGFAALRGKMPMNLRRTYRSFNPDAETRQDIERVAALWAWARAQGSHTGPYLFGAHFSAADAFFAPVAARFKTYGIKLEADDEAYADALLAHPATRTFHDEALRETWVMPHNEFDGD